jgi:hypothetical protein
MANYTTIIKIGYRLHMTISATSRPNSNEVAELMNQATALINAECMVSTNMTDTYGILSVIECNLVVRAIRSMLAFADPENYFDEPMALTLEEKRTLHMAHRKWATLTWSVGE